MVFVSSFHPRGGVFCCSWRDRAGFFFFEAGRGGLFFFPTRNGAVVVFFRGGTGRLFFFPRRDGVAFFSFFDRTGRGVFFFFFQGPGRDGCFWRWQFFWRDGAKSLHRPVKGGLNRPASRPCKALIFTPNIRFEHFPPDWVDSQKVYMRLDFSSDSGRDKNMKCFIRQNSGTKLIWYPIHHISLSSVLRTSSTTHSRNKNHTRHFEVNTLSLHRF